MSWRAKLEFLGGQLVPSQQSQREMLGRMLQGGDASGRTLADFLLASFPYGAAPPLCFPVSTVPRGCRPLER